MKFIKQTISNKDNGNCLAACIASLLEKDINNFPEIPNSDKWFDSMNEWVKINYNYELLPIDLNKRQNIETVLIAVGESPVYKNKEHAVLWQNGKILFDPSLSNKGLKDLPKYYILLLKIFK